MIKEYTTSLGRTLPVLCLSASVTFDIDYMRVESVFADDVAFHHWQWFKIQPLITTKVYFLNGNCGALAASPESPGITHSSSSLSSISFLSTVCLGSRNKSIPAHFSLLKKNFGSKKTTRVIHQEFNSLCTDITKKISSAFGSQRCSRLNPMLNSLGN